MTKSCNQGDLLNLADANQLIQMQEVNKQASKAGNTYQRTHIKSISCSSISLTLNKNKNALDDNFNNNNLGGRRATNTLNDNDNNNNNQNFFTHL